MSDAQHADDIAAALTAAWLWTVGLATTAAFAAILAGETRYPTLRYVNQDVPAIIATTVAMIFGLRFVATPTRVPGHMTRITATFAIAVSLAALIGHRLVFHGYGLSMDEFWALFDAQILRSGHFVAPVPAQFRDLLPALQTSFRLPVADNAGWASLYLPINAAFLALPGGAIWVPPLLAGLSVALVAAIARRLTPDRRDTQFVAVLLFASSPQLLVTAMTAYAMTAHLALNLLWLWLVLRDRRSSHFAAAIVAWLATGLHQLVFHPLFAAPFVLSIWRERRWGVAAFHSLAYLAIGLFWVSWWHIALHSEGLAGVGPGPGLSFAKIRDLLVVFSPGDLGLVAQNLLRFIVWQNPLTIALFMLGIRASLRARGIRRDLLLGIALTLLVVAVMMPAQGFGWGYRYLHGLLGNVALLAALAWDELAGAEESRRGYGQALVMVSAGFAFLILLPIHGWNAHRLAAPYAQVSERLAQVDADYVLINPGLTAHGTDLARNDPWLRNRPKIIDLAELNLAQIRRLCAGGSVAIFGTREAIAAGLPQLRAVFPPEPPENPRLVAALGCDRRRVGRGPAGGGRYPSRL